MTTNYCDACGTQSPDLIHVTLTMDLFSARTRRKKIVQFWLCDHCEKNNRYLLENRYGREGRVAKAITPAPAWAVAD